MSIGQILLVILLLCLIGVFPIWPHAVGWGYGPSSIVGTTLIVLIILLVMGKL